MTLSNQFKTAPQKSFEYLPLQIAIIGITIKIIFVVRLLKPSNIHDYITFPATILFNDLNIFGIFIIIWSISCTTKGVWRVFVDIIAYFLSLWFLLDSMLVVGYSARLSLTNIALYYLYASDVILSPAVVFPLVLFVSLLTYLGVQSGTRPRRGINYKPLLIGFLLLWTPSVLLFPWSHDLATPISGSRGILKSLTGDSEPVDSLDVRTNKCEFTQRFFSDFSPPKNKPNIILLLIESLSSVDSLRFGGINNNLPELDKLSHEGLIATNCLAQAKSTDFGLVAILTGLVPLQYPTSPYDVFMLTKNQEKVTRKYRNLGYSLAFWASSDLSFRRKKDFIQSLGFQSIWDTNVPGFLTGKRHAEFNSVSDNRLYKAALSSIRSLKEPYLLVLETTSSHEPSSGALVNSEGTWKYVDRQISNFVNNLRKQNYSGIVVITGDHRKRASPTQREWDRFGDSTPYRIPLIVLGEDFKAGAVLSEPIAQNNILSSLGELSASYRPKDNFIIVPALREASIFGRRKTEYKVFERHGDLRKAITVKAMNFSHEIEPGALDPSGHQGLLDYLFCYSTRLYYCINNNCDKS